MDNWKVSTLGDVTVLMSAYNWAQKMVLALVNWMATTLVLLSEFHLGSMRV